MIPIMNTELFGSFGGIRSVGAAKSVFRLPSTRTQFAISDCLCSLLICYDIKRETYCVELIKLNSGIEIEAMQ